MHIAFKTLLGNISLSKVFLIGLILIVPFIYSHKTLDPALAPRHLALNVLLLSNGFLVLYFYLRSKFDIDKAILTSNIFKVYLLYLLVAAISMIFAWNKPEAIFEWFKLWTFFTVFLFLAIFLFQDRKNYIFLVRLVIIYSILVSMWGFYEFIILSISGKLDHQSSYQIHAFSSNRNLFSQILFFTLPFTLFGIFRFKAVWRGMGIFASVFIVIMVTVLLVRSVWIALVVSLMFSVSCFVIFHKAFSLNKTTIRTFTLALFAGIIIIVSGILLFSKYGDSEVFKKQIHWIGNYKYGSSLERIDIWENTIKMSLDHPVTGVGSGNWRIKFPAYGLEDLRSESGEIFFQRPHNDFLWVLAENGIGGLILYLMLFFLAYRYLFKVIKRSPDLEKRYLALAMIFGLTGFTVISFFSFPKERIEHQIYFQIIIAIALTEFFVPDLKNQKRKNGWLKFFFMLIVAMMTVGTYFTLNRFISEKHIARGYYYREKQAWLDEIAAYKMATSYITKVDVFSTPLEWYIGEAYYNLNKIDSAHLYFQKAYEVNPHHLHVLNNLGTTYELTGNSKKAEILFLEAHKIAPRFEDPNYNLCALYYNKAEYGLAYKFVRNIDIHSNNPKYKKYLKAVLWHIIDEFNSEINDKVISKSILRIRNSDEWMQKVHVQSIENESAFEKQLLLEVIYLLESVDGTITSEEAENYRKKFNLQ